MRIATIDAYLFAHEDAPEAQAALRALAREEDRWAIGLPRRAADFDPDTFDRRAAERAAAWGDRPPAPAHAERG